MGKLTKILVTGDYGRDCDLYLPTDEDNPPPGTPPARVKVTVGGAGISLQVLQAVEAELAGRRKRRPSAPGIRVGFSGTGDFTSPPTAALWQKYRFGKLGRTPEDENVEVWRIRRSLSLGDVAGQSVRLSADAPKAATANFKPKIVVVEDNVGGYRFRVPGWLKAAKKTAANLPTHVILKTSTPICHGEFWWALTGKKGMHDRLTVVVAVRDLRASEVRVSEGISWERTALDLARELSQSPRLEGLRHARNVVVTMHGEGALLMERTGEAGKPETSFRFTLVFDPGYMEGEWSHEVCGRDGNAYGFHSTFAAALAARLALPDGTMLKGIKSGLRAMRLLRAVGHGTAAGHVEPGLPVNALARVILADDADVKTDGLPGIPKMDPRRLGSFSDAVVPWDPAADVPAEKSCPGGGEGWRPSGAGSGTTCGNASSWCILEAGDGDPLPDRPPLYGLGRRVAMFGIDGLGGAPYACFGELFTADRDEIEALRNIQRLMQDYETNEAEDKPLSIAVFGPPGSGKSFAIKQIAKTALRGKTSSLEFNLSQFSDNRDLIGAFHQVRDKVLEGGMPIVFWDEFDSQNYKWLQYLLAPMQDGKFQEGQVTHPIGRCVFVFAGATSYDLKNFGPPDEPPEGADPAEYKQAVADFRLKKGPDFKSRLHGNLNVLGPNRRQCFDASKPQGKQWADDTADVCFPVRRAILLRAGLGMMDPKKKESRRRLKMDPGVLAALLEVDHYTHGARSMSKIVAALKQDAARGYRRSALPTKEVLDLSVRELKQFMEIMDQPQAFQHQARRLAPAIHAAWAKVAERKNAYRKGFQKLPDEMKGDNYEAAVRIPVILGLVGLELVEEKDPRPAVPDVDGFLKRRIDLLAEEEHNAWMEVRLDNGWKLCPKPENEAVKNAQKKKHLHPSLVPFARLDQRDKNKDRTSIRNIPTVARLAGFKIVARMPSTA